MYWKRVEELIRDHNELVKSISTKIVALFNNTNDDNDDDDKAVGKFFNQP